MQALNSRKAQEQTSTSSPTIQLPTIQTNQPVCDANVEHSATETQVIRTAAAVPSSLPVAPGLVTPAALTAALSLFSSLATLVTPSTFTETPSSTPELTASRTDVTVTTAADVRNSTSVQGNSKF